MCFIEGSKWTFWPISNTYSRPPCNTSATLLGPRQARMSLRVSLRGMMWQLTHTASPTTWALPSGFYRSSASFSVLGTCFWISFYLAHRSPTRSSFDLNPCTASSVYRNKRGMEFLLHAGACRKKPVVVCLVNIHACKIPSICSSQSCFLRDVSTLSDESKTPFCWCTRQLALGWPVRFSWILEQFPLWSWWRCLIAS